MGGDNLSEDGSKGFRVLLQSPQHGGQCHEAMAYGSTIVLQKPTGARDGNRTHDPSLTKTVRYRCATRANLRKAGGQWRIRTSEALAADLQSAPFDHFGNCPDRGTTRTY